MLWINRLPAYGYFRLLRVIAGVCRWYKWHQDRRGVAAVPFFSLSEVNFKAVKAGDVPCRAGKGYSHFLIDSPDIPVHSEALAVGQSYCLECLKNRVPGGCIPGCVIFAANSEGNRPCGKIK